MKAVAVAARPVGPAQGEVRTCSTPCTRYWLEGEGMRVEVTVISDQDLAVPLGGFDDVTMSESSGTERVTVRISDADNSSELVIPDAPRHLVT